MNSDKIIQNITQISTHFSKKMDGTLSIHGINYKEYLILLTLSEQENQTMRRIDLAEALEMSASGITRALNPLEKLA